MLSETAAKEIRGQAEEATNYIPSTYDASISSGHLGYVFGVI